MSKLDFYLQVLIRLDVEDEVADLICLGDDKEKECSVATALHRKACDLCLLYVCTAYLLVRDNSYDNLEMSLHKAVKVG